MNAQDIEIAVANYYGYRQNIIIPNLSWGADFGHECDMIIMRPSGSITEVEIKISKSDLKADFKKGHNHASKYIRYLFYAYPETMSDCDTLIPYGAGIFHIVKLELQNGGHYLSCKQIRGAVGNKTVPLNDKQKINIMRLGYMRIWSLKQHLKEKRY